MSIYRVSRRSELLIIKVNTYYSKKNMGRMGGRKAGGGSNFLKKGAVLRDVVIGGDKK